MKTQSFWHAPNAIVVTDLFISCIAAVTSLALRGAAPLGLNRMTATSFLTSRDAPTAGACMLQRSSKCFTSQRCMSVRRLPALLLPHERSISSRSLLTRAVAAPEQDAPTKAQPSKAYPFSQIESKWQAFWDDQQTFRTPSTVDTSKPKYYVLDMFPYPRCGALGSSGLVHVLVVGRERLCLVNARC